MGLNQKIDEKRFAGMQGAFWLGFFGGFGMKTANEVTTNIGERIPDPDVIVIVWKDNQIVNGTGGVLKGMSSALGRGVLGIMRLGVD